MMALTAHELMSNRFVRDVTNDTFALSVTFNTTDAVMFAGFLRDPEGRLVVKSG